MYHYNHTFYNIYNKHVCCNVLVNCTDILGNSCRSYIPYCETSIRLNFGVLKMLPLWNALR